MLQHIPRLSCTILVVLCFLNSFPNVTPQCIPLDSETRSDSSKIGVKLLDGDILVDVQLSPRQQQEFRQEELVWPDAVIPVAYHKCKVLKMSTYAEFNMTSYA